MSTYATPGDKHLGSDRRIEGPIPEYDQRDRFTGVTFFRCGACGAEALAREHLQGCCEDQR